jgi:hypothetical protein
MDYRNEIRDAAHEPKRLEQIYSEAQNKQEEAAFQAALIACYEDSSDNLLYAAWYYRLQQVTKAIEDGGRRVNWKLAIPLSIITGLIFWGISDFEWTYLDLAPMVLLLWSPIAGLSGILFLSATAKGPKSRVILVGLTLVLATVYVLLLGRWQSVDYQLHYITMMSVHIPLLCWIAIGITVLGARSSVQDRFAFLTKSIEVIITAGVYLIVGMIFGGITIGMFDALNIVLPELAIRLIAAGGFGLLPVLALATAYNPQVNPSEQDFQHGLSKFIATMMRLLLPLTLVVLFVYLLVIPFKFMEPFKNRDVLIVYNVMLFAIMGLIIGTTPVLRNGLPHQGHKYLRYGIITVAILTVVVSVYALSATVYRTILGGLTINRVTIIGWNTINISILLRLIYKQFKGGAEKWIENQQTVLSQGTNAYLVWTLFLMFAVPLIFR